MFKNENHEAWHGQHDSIELYSFCPEGYYPVDRGKWCQHYERGPSGVIGGIPGQKIKPIATPISSNTIIFSKTGSEEVLSP